MDQRASLLTFQLAPGLLVQRWRQCTHTKRCAQSLEPGGELPSELLLLLLLLLLLRV